MYCYGLDCKLGICNPSNHFKVHCEPVQHAICFSNSFKVIQAQLRASSSQVGNHMQSQCDSFVGKRKLIANRFFNFVAFVLFLASNLKQFAA